MADLSINAANVAAGTSGQEVIENVIAGAAVTAGQVVYKDTSDNLWKLAQCDDAALLAGSADFGIALNTTSASGQPLTIIKKQGNLSLGSILTQGVVYVISATPGGICPLEDLTTEDDYITILGIAASASVLQLFTHYSGVQIPGA